MEDLGRPKSRVRVPTVLSREEVARLLGVMAPSGTSGLIARALYGTGMRLGECLQLRVKDVDFDRAVVVVRQGKGGKDRVVRLPEALRRNSSAHVKHGSGTGRRACRAWRCPMRLRSSCRMPANREVGSGSGRRALYRSIRVAVFGAGIISIARRSAAPLPARRARRESASSDRAYASALVCDASARVRRGHSTRAGIARTQRCDNYHDLHARAEVGCRRNAQSARRSVDREPGFERSGRRVGRGAVCRPMPRLEARSLQVARHRDIAGPRRSVLA